MIHNGKEGDGLSPLPPGGYVCEQLRQVRKEEFCYGQTQKYLPHWAVSPSCTSAPEMENSYQSTIGLDFELLEEAMSSSCTSASEMGNFDRTTVDLDCGSSKGDCLQRCLSDFVLLNLASKGELLQSLSLYLSHLAATMSASTEEFSLSAQVGSSRVRLTSVEVLELHEVLVRELDKHTQFLTTPQSAVYVFSEVEGDRKDEVLSRTLYLQVIAETLRCCIRILPLVDCFDTSASLSGAASLHSLMQQVCSPARVFEVLSRNDSKCREQLMRTSLPGVQGCGARSELTFTEEILKVFSQRSDIVDVFNADSQFERAAQHQRDIFLAILEVYMDELLISPDLGARFLSFQDEAGLFLNEERLMSSFARPMEASLQAVFVHALLSCPSKMPMQGAKISAPTDTSPVCSISLPASLLLLESLAEKNVPAMYMTHIVQLVARVLDGSTRREPSQVSGITSLVGQEDCSCWSGGVDWSYCVERVTKKSDDQRDWFLRPKCLPLLTTLHFASSTFEQSMLMYRRFSTMRYSDTVGENGGQFVPPTPDDLIVRSCVSKYRSLLDMFCNKPELEARALFAKIERVGTLDHEKAMFEAGSGDGVPYSEIYLEILESCVHYDNQADKVGIWKGTNDVCATEEKGKGDGPSSLVSAVLQLGISAVKCITREIGNLMGFPSDIRFHWPRGHSSSTATLEEDADRILEFVSLYLSSFLPRDDQARVEPNESYSKQEKDGHRVTDVVYCGRSSLVKSVGKAILFFTNVFCSTVQNGAPEELVEDYFHLVESLVGLLLVVDGSQSSRACSESYLIHGRPSVSQSEVKVSVDNASVERVHRYKNAFTWLEAMVFLLQNMLRELAANQSLLPEFLLDFVLQQISRDDGLNLVAMAFSGSLEQCLDGRECHQTVTWNVGSFQSRDLVIQILQLALTNPNRSYSFSTLIGYTSSILQNLQPITATLSLHEIAESLSCYEHIASTFTLACQFAVSEQLMVTRNGRECRFLLLSRMCEGIERLFTEGTAVAQWMSNWITSKAVPAWSTYSDVTAFRSNCSVEAQHVVETSLSEEGQFRFCTSFLVQIDLLQRAVGVMPDASDWFLMPQWKFSSLFLKARTFLESFLRLRVMVDKPGSQWRVHAFLREQLRDAVNSVGEDRLMNCQQVDKGTDGSGSIGSQLKDIPQGNSSGPEKYGLDDDSGKIQEENARSLVRDAVPSGRGPVCEVGTLEQSAAQKTQCIGGDTLEGKFQIDRDIHRKSVDVELVRLKVFLSSEENDAPCLPFHSGTQQEDQQAEGPTLTGCTDKDETCKIPLMGKRITRSATLFMSETSRDAADMPNGVLVVESVEPWKSKKRQGYSSTTLSIAKRLVQLRQPLHKKAKGDIRDFSRRLTKELPLVSREPESTVAQIEQNSHKNGVANQDAVWPTVVSNPYIQSIVGNDSCQSEKFDDLNDFIVCKKGRNYSKWLKRRQKVRRRLHTRNLFRRLQEKRDLLLLLDICE